MVKSKESLIEKINELLGIAIKNAGNSWDIIQLCTMNYLRLGNFEEARVYLSEANNISPNVAAVLAELADCYSLCGEDKFGKVLFREAFFINAKKCLLMLLTPPRLKLFVC